MLDSFWVAPLAGTPRLGRGQPSCIYCIIIITIIIESAVLLDWVPSDGSLRACYAAVTIPCVYACASVLCVGGRVCS